MLEGKKILVTGGCGFIGSHTVVDLLNKGATVLILDNLINAEEHVLQRIASICGKSPEFIRVDLADFLSCREIIPKLVDVEAVIHFAALKSVGESVLNPILYYENNLLSLINMIKICVELGINHFVFSSSCSVYGNAEKLPVDEFAPRQNPISPYAKTKIIGEDILLDTYKVFDDFQAVILRYFNPAGAHPSSLIGESPRNAPNNLVPVICEVAAGIRTHLEIFGKDYPTVDGTCIRDYIHVMDIAAAHTLALEFQMSGAQDNQVEIFNLGLGKGLSVLEVVRAFEEANKIHVPYKYSSRRPGDVAAVFADNTKAKNKMGWIPQFDIFDICNSAWKWQLNKSKYYSLLFIAFFTQILG